MRRRTFLAAAVGASASLAGCRNAAAPGAADPRQATATPRPAVAASTPMECGEHERLDVVDRVATGRLAGFSMATDPTVVSVGDELAVSLTNVSGSGKTIGNRYKYDVQQRVGEDWESVYWDDGTAVWTDVGYGITPGGGYEWEFALDRDGLRRDERHDSLNVCGPVTSGTYRFVFFGVPTDEYDGVAAEFRVVDD